jgi:glycosyltransferase involved in cell wall biosynthesis
VRVGLIIYGSLDFVSGGFLYDRMLVEHLRRQGDQVDVVSLPWRRYIRCLTDNFSLSVRWRLERSNWDVLLQDELNHPSLFRLNRILRKRVSYPVISIVHHLRSCEFHQLWSRRFYRHVERKYLDSVDGFVFNSQTTRSEVEALIGTGKPGRVAYPGRDHLQPTVTPDQIAERAIQPGPLKIVFLGNVIRRKGLHTLLEALSRLPKGTWQLDVVGELSMDRRYAAAIRRQIAKAGLVDSVKLRGFLPDSVVADRLSRSHLLAVPSSYEGFGIIYSEAMGFGLPVIASSAGAASEVISDEKEGLLINPGDADALTKHIQALSQDRRLLLQMSLKALKRHESFPTWEQSAARIRHFLEDQSDRRSRLRGG